MDVFHSTPYRHGDIGGGINAFLELLPADAWACIRDADTLFFPGGQHLVERIVDTNPKFDLIGCMTNRIRLPWQLHDGKISDNDRIGYHQKIAIERHETHDVRVTDAPCPIAGMFMLFRVKTWRQMGGFATHSATFDKQFSKAIVQAGGRLGVAQGIYLWHSYRLGHANPTESIDHLREMMP